MGKDNSLVMFFYYSRNTMRSWFQYKVDAFVRSIAVFLREATAVIVIYLTLLSFHSINGWKAKDLLFLYSLVFLTYGVLIIFFTGLRDFGGIVQDGTLDRFILRPRGILFQIISSNADWFAAIGHGSLGVVLFVFSANQVGITWNLLTVSYYISTVIGGVLIQAAIWLLIASLSFFLIQTDNIKSLFYWNARKFAGYPISVFPKLIQVFLIYVVPFAFVNYFPAQFLLHKPDLALYPQWYLYISPFVGVTMYILAYEFWRLCLSHYASTGN